MDICRLSAEAALARMETGDLTARDLVQACLDRIADREDAVGAWTFLDPDRKSVV